jgi:GAF domain-containing protein
MKSSHTRVSPLAVAESCEYAVSMTETVAQDAASNEFNFRVDHLLQTTCELGIVLAKNEAICLNEDEVEKHPSWRAFAESAGKHPPLRGLLAVPIVGEDGLNYGLLQVSDKVDASDFSPEDERRLQWLADAAAVGLDALRKVRALRLGELAPAAPLEAGDRFVVIESP